MPPTLDGATEGKEIFVRYALVLRCEFVSVGKDSGPFRGLCFKTSSKGTCNNPGCIIRFPVLDVMQHGLEHAVYHKVQGLAELGVSLARLELGRRSDYTFALA